MLLKTALKCPTVSRPVVRSTLGHYAIRALLLASVAFGLPACVSDTHLTPSARAAQATGEVPGSTASTLLRVARTTRDNGDLASAVTAYKQVHALSSGRADILIELGQVLSALGSHNEAAEVYRKALRLEPKNTDGLRGLGNSLLAMNQPALAIEQFIAGLAIQDDPRLYNGMAVAHDMNGNFDTAQTSYRSGLALAPNDTNLRNNQALSLAITGKFNEAIEILSRLITEPRATARQRQNLSLVYGLAGKFAEAARIARVDFDEPTVQNNLAYYETLRALSLKQRAAAVFGIAVVPTASPVSNVQPASGVAASSDDESRRKRN